VPRKKQPERITDPFERARLKKLRAAQRREERKKRKAEAAAKGEDAPRRSRSAAPDYSKPMVRDDYLWIRRDRQVAYANRMLNGKSRPYWLSIPHAYGDGVLPVSNFYPCTMFRTQERAYYGFMFREHRDLFLAQQENARKELTDTIRSMKPDLV
jgi:hypothetical protein